MTKNEKYALADLVIRHALKNGASQVSVSVDEVSSTEIEIRDQMTDSLKEAIQNRLTIRLYVDKKYSSHSTNRMKEDELLHFVEEGIAATRFLAVDEYRSLPDPALCYQGGGSDLNLYDPKLIETETRTKIDLALQAMNEAWKKDDRVISVNSNYGDYCGNSVLINSNGFRGDSANSYVYLNVSVATKSDSGRPSDYWSENALFLDKLTKTGIGQKALNRVLAKMGPRKISSGKYTVVIENRVAGSLLDPIMQSLNGRSIQQKQSFLIGKIDQAIASPVLSVTDDPLVPSAPGSRYFDSEGLAMVRRPVLEKGVLKRYYIDNYYGRKLGMKPTSGESGNLIFSLGNRSGTEMVASLKKGVLITGFIGGNCNPSTGDFSYGIDGYYIENGKAVHPVNEMNIAGNMKDFWFKLREMGNDPMPNATTRTPAMLLDEVDLSGL